MPSESALEESRRCRLGTISYAQPFDWLARGWRDMLKKPVPALAHGLVVALFGISLLLWRTGSSGCWRVPSAAS